MAVSNNKLKILYIMQALLEKSDENHVLSAADLAKILERQGLSADRKTIYGDIDTLKEFGLDILQIKGGSRVGYYIGAREFELPELKLLVDAVQASKFITIKKSRELIDKLEKLAGIHDARRLNRDVYIYNRPKTGNETIYYNVDRIHEAISDNRQISFQYSEWTVKKELVPKKKGMYYIVSPWALTWDDENYYLIAYDEEADKMKHYRVDKMKNTAETEQERIGQETFKDFNLADFAKKTFGMYGGKDEDVTMAAHKSLAGVMIDRFGKDVFLVPAGEEQFRLTVPVAVSPQFFGWLTGLGDKVRILGPENVKSEYQNFLKGILDHYHK